MRGDLKLSTIGNILCARIEVRDDDEQCPCGMWCKDGDCSHDQWEGVWKYGAEDMSVRGED